jgi:hypothetical protein
MSQTMYRNKNRGKELVDYDLNIYMPEEFDESLDDYFFDPASWRIQVYIHKDGDQNVWDDPIVLTAEEIQSLGFNRDEYFKNEVDTWYGLEGFRLAYWHKMSDRLKEYFDRLPKYWEDITK